MFRKFSFLLMTALFICALPSAQANPFTVDNVTIPAKSESAPAAIATGTASGEADAAQPGTEEPSLIKDL
ncbi:MAG TPA: hypothetical protein PKC25_13125, partial [Candidatus Rifleibacterium sp.]|nr:hypothetical protein [Candidatus Rifleibacterium sp.]